MTPEAKLQEVMCRECDGTGNDAGMKPVRLGEAVAYRTCTKCGGSGHVKETRQRERREEAATKPAFERWAIVGAVFLAVVAFGVTYWKVIGLIAVCMFGGIGCL